MALVPVADARALIVKELAPLGTEFVTLDRALGRVLAEDVIARVSHPAADVSAMDGYAVRSADVTQAPTTLRVVGESAAGHPWSGKVSEGETARIFTGAHVPMGADAVVIQEDTDLGVPIVTVRASAQKGRHIRPKAQDFAANSVVLPRLSRLNPRQIGLVSAANVAEICVFRRPKVGVLSTGDEVVLPGTPLKEGQLASANGPALCAFITEKGGEALHLGIARDDPKSLLELIENAAGLDMIVTSGGVSVGDHDLIQQTLSEAGLKVSFHKIAMRPGKPLLFGTLRNKPFMGLPGNPVSAMVCAILFLGPALDAMQGLPGDAPFTITAKLGADMKEGDTREDYVRATLTRDTDGSFIATPFPVQDSAMLSFFAQAGVLIIRKPNAAPAQKGEAVQAVILNGFG